MAKKTETNNNNGNKEFKPTVGFWKQSGKYGEFYSSMPIDAAAYDELQKMGIGDRLVLNTVKSDNTKAPTLRLSVQRAAAASKSQAKRQATQSASDEI